MTAQSRTLTGLLALALTVALGQAWPDAGAAAFDDPVPADQPKITGDWTMWGGTPGRNMTCAATGLTFDFDLKEERNVTWVARLGSQTYGNAIVSGGRIFVGTNNGGEYRPQHKGDRGCLLCFDEKTGEFLWQLTREKLLTGQVNDWPYQGICSAAAVEGDRLWVVTNRCELMCLDAAGFTDGENDGPVTDEVDAEAQDADIIWSLDMIDQLGVFPHNLATSSPVIVDDLVFIVTGNGVDEGHLEIPSPRSPSFLAVNKNTGEVAWESTAPGDGILHGQWSSPTAGVVNGVSQVVFPGGNGWLYAFEAHTGREIWRADLNPKDAEFNLGGYGTRNNIISTPVFIENSVVVGVGEDPDHGEGVGHFWRIDATKTGDVSRDLGGEGEPIRPNPNSGVIWHFGGVDEDGSVTGEPGDDAFHRTLSTAAIADGKVWIADLSGYFYCIDFETGKPYWRYDLKSAIWGSPMLVDGRVLLGSEDGRLYVFEANSDAPVVQARFDTKGASAIYSTPTIANGFLYLTDRTRLYAIKVQ